MASFNAQFLDQLRARVSVSSVVGARVKLVRKGNRLWGCCPFHNEKTPSFTVSDDKEFYHCFGCGEHGDVIAFVMRTQGLSFTEAVTQLSGQAGLQIPRQSPADKAREQKRLSLYEVCDIACTFFEKNLHSTLGTQALQYLDKRGVSRDYITHFRLGFSPDSRTFLTYMKSHNIDESALIDAGLASRGDKGLYAFFRNRLMFPICDTRGRVVAFGGRFMGDEKQAKVGKYINSPEGILYDKSNTLYNLKHARESGYKENRLIVCEGYMDVIALVQSGFGYAVAPCGTAMTDAQILQCWKVVDEPILCFDGDSAGQKAGLRACERALPLLKSGKSVQIAILPSGQDPDDLVRTQGADAMQGVLESAYPLHKYLWNHAIQTFETDTPERLARLERHLFQWAGSITDKTISSHYRQIFNDFVWKTFKSFGKGGKNTSQSQTKALQGLRLGERQQQCILACFLNHPSLLDIYEERFTDFFSEPYNACFHMACDMRGGGLDSADAIRVELEKLGYGATVSAVCNDGIYMLDKGARVDTDLDLVSHRLDEALRLQEAARIKLHIRDSAHAYLRTGDVSGLDTLGECYRQNVSLLYDMDDSDDTDV